MDRQEARELIERYRTGNATAEQVARIETWILEGQVNDMDLSEAELEAELEQIRKRLPLRRPIQRIRRWLPYAAAAAILLAVGWLLLVDSRESSVDSLAATEILPGGNRATLTLADGRVINLDEAQTGIVVGAEAITYDDGSVVSPADSPHAGLTTYDLQLTTPKGGQYQITLPDGSKAWLNSASTLKYPSRFSGDSREVILEGEAFFKIQEIQGARVSRVPFKVLTAGQTVEVLGTEFNISAYKDDPETKTTLVEGSVKVTPGTQTGLTTNDSRPTTNVLTPGQQAIVSGTRIEITAVDTEPYTAWKDGYFVLEATIPEMLKQISRWYDIEVVYKGHDGENTGYYAKLQRDLPLSDILEGLQVADPTLKYSITPVKTASANRNGRRLTIFR